MDSSNYVEDTIHPEMPRLLIYDNSKCGILKKRRHNDTFNLSDKRLNNCSHLYYTTTMIYKLIHLL